MPTFADNQNDKQHNMRHFLFLTVATLCLLSCHRSGTFEMTYNGEELLSAARQKIQLNDIDGSMEDIQNAMRIAKSEGDDSLYIEALYTSAVANIMAMNDSIAWENALIAESLSRKKGFNKTLVKSLIAKGRICDYSTISAEDNRDEEGLAYLKEAESIAEMGNSWYQELAECCYTISEIYVNMNRWNATDLNQEIYKNAGAYLDKADHYARLTQNTDVFAQKSRLYHLRYLRQGGRFNDAITYCDSVISNTPENDYLTLFQIYDQLTSLYCATEQPAEAAASHDNCIYNAQLYLRKQAESQIQEMQTKYETEIKENIIAHRNWELAIISLFLALCILVSIQLYKKNQKISASNANLVKTLIQNDKLLTIAKNTPSNTTDSNIITEISNDVVAFPDIHLTKREMEIARLSCDGLMSKEIADRLNISIRTVGVHKNNLYKKLGINNNIELLRYMQKTGQIIAD